MVSTERKFQRILRLSGGLCQSTFLCHSLLALLTYHEPKDSMCKSETCVTFVRQAQKIVLCVAVKRRDDAA